MFSRLSEGGFYIVYAMQKMLLDASSVEDYINNIEICVGVFAFPHSPIPTHMGIYRSKGTAPQSVAFTAPCGCGKDGP